MKLSLKLICLFGAALVVAGVVLWRYSHHGPAPTLSSARPVTTASPPIAGAQTSMSARSALHQDNIPAATSASEKPPPSLPERIRPALTRDAGVGFRDRVLAVRALKTPLTDAERDAFYRYLRASANDPQNRVGEEWLRNELLDKLVQQEVLPAQLPDLLVAIYQDHDQDVVIRDYAVQHMAPAYERADAKDQARLQAAMWQATGETGTSIAGTALLALLDLSQSGSSLDQGRIAQVSLNMAENNQAGELSRITAVQVCGRMNVEPALSAIEELAQHAESIPLRIAATAALGDMGTPQSANFLNRLAGSTDPRQALAIESALRRINRRQMTSAEQTEVHR